MPTIEEQIADDLLSYSLDLFRLEASLRKDALSLLDKMRKDLEERLTGKNLTDFSKARLSRLLDEATKAIADYYSQIERGTEGALRALPGVSNDVTRAALIGVGFGPALAPLKHLETSLKDVLIQGAPSKEWWKRQSADTAFRFSNALRQGIAQGSTNQEIIRSVLKSSPTLMTLPPHVQVAGVRIPITMPERSASAGDSLVYVDVAKTDALFAKEKSFYIAKGGEGGIKGRYARFEEFVKGSADQAPTKSIEASELGIWKGSVSFNNGRHRWAWLRDHGVKIMPVSIDAESLKEAKRLGLLVDPPVIKGPSSEPILAVSRRNAAALVQTSVQTVANVSRLESFRQNRDIVKGVRQLSTLDGHTSKVCIAYSGMEWDLDGNPISGNQLAFNGGPPRHWNCRSVLVPITKTFKELGIDISEPERTTRASSEGQISAGTSFNDFLIRKGTAYQDAILGKGRAELWREKKITLQQLLDLSGNPLSLAELQAKYT